MKNLTDYEIISEIERKAYRVHEDVNQKYDEYPYFYHLNKVTLKAVELINAWYPDMDDETFIGVVFGSLFHDSIEDARLTYNDVKKIAREYMDEDTAVMATEIVYALTNEKGRNRAERANEKYYAGIRENEMARLVKLADRLANTEYSKETGSRMFEIYKKEMPHFLESIGVKYEDIPQHLQELLK